MIKLLEKAKNIFLNIIFPNICFACKNNLKQNEEVLCRECFQSIDLNKNLPINIGENIKLFHITSYQNKVIKDLIHKLKFKKLKSTIKPIHQITNAYLKNQNIKANIIIPIPLSRKRFSERGFNQSELIAQTISQILNIPLQKNLIKIKHTTPQSTLTISQRQSNIKNVFKIKNPENLKNKNIILVDDIYTSGATTSEAIKTLNQANPKEITIIVLAKT